MGIFKRIFNRVSGNELLKKEYAEHEENKESSALAKSEEQEGTPQKSALLFSGGQAVRTPPKKPVNIKEAGILAEKILKGD